MSISGIRPGLAGAPLLPGGRDTRDAEQASQPVRSNPPAVAAAPAPRHDGLVPSEAPEGTDPALWQVLTPEERSFFARARSLGPLTYGPGPARGGMPGLAQGGRIDVRV